MERPAVLAIKVRISTRAQHPDNPMLPWTCKTITFGVDRFSAPRNDEQGTLYGNLDIYHVT
jgi:hypothetical protein